MPDQKKLHKLSFTEDELALVKGGVSSIRAQVFDKWKSTPPGDERDFYSLRTDECDALLVKIERMHIADTSLDADPDEEKDEEDQHD